jgi:TolB protein
VAWSRLPGRLAYSRAPGSGGGGFLYVADGTRQQVRLVDSADVGYRSLYYLAWSPDGRITYSQLPVTCCSTPWSIIAVSSDTGGVPQLLYEGGIAGSWSGDGHLAYSCLDGGLCIDGERVLCSETTVGGSRPAWERDDVHLVFALDSRPGSYGLYVLDTRSDSLAPLLLASNDSVDYFNPILSPDGGRIAFERSVAYVPGGEIWVANADGTGATRLTSDHNDTEPAWSPDGSEIAFIRNEEVWLMNSDGSDQARALSGTSIRSIAWSP